MADNSTSGAISGATMGASAGASAGPYGALIGGVVGGAYGYYQGDKADKAEANRPKYQIPPEVYKNLTQAEQQALVGLSDESKQLFINNLQRGQAYSLREAGSRKSGIAGLAALNQNQNDAMLGLAVQNEAAKKAALQNVYAMRNQLADQRGQAFQINQSNPYYEKRAQQNAYAASTEQNLGNVIAQGAMYSNNRNKPVANSGNPAYSNYGQPSPQASYVAPVYTDPNQSNFQNTTPDPYANQTQVTGLVSPAYNPFQY